MGDCNTKEKTMARELLRKCETLPKEGDPDLLKEKHFILQNSKEGALSRAGASIIPQRETHVTQSKQCKSMATQDAHHFPGHMPPTLPFTAHSVETYSDRLSN